MSRRILVFVLSLSVFPLFAAATEQTPEFYHGLAPVESRSEADREQATKAALTEVLVRMTGDVSVSLRDSAAALLDQAPRFVRSFRYLSSEDLLPGEDEPQPLLQVQFDGRALQAQAKRAGLPLWSAQRPVTLVWLLGPYAGQSRYIYGASQAEELAPGLLLASQRRGVPLRFPVSGGGDIKVMDVVGQDAVRLQGAGQDYQARHNLLVQLRENGNVWEVRWAALREGPEPLRWFSQGEDINQALNAGFDQYADHLAAQYALRVTAGWVQNSRLRVLGINDLTAYAKVLNHLQALNLVQSVQVSELQGSEVVFQLKFEGETRDLERSLELADVLVPAPESAPKPVDFQTIGANGEALPKIGPETSSQQSGLSFFAVNRQPELRYRLRR